VHKKQQDRSLNGDKKSSTIIATEKGRGKKTNLVEISAFSWKHARPKNNHTAIRPELLDHHL